MMKSLTITCACIALTACSSGSDLAHEGAKAPLNDAQFAELKSSCGLDDATLVSSSRTESMTTGDDIPVTITYENDDASAKTIKLSRTRSEGEMAQLIICVNEQFATLNAEASIAIPEGQLGL